MVIRDYEAHGRYTLDSSGPTVRIARVKIYTEDNGYDIPLQQVLHLLKYIVRSHRVDSNTTTKQVFESLRGMHSFQLLFSPLLLVNDYPVSQATKNAFKVYEGALTDQQFNSLYNAFAYKTSVIQGRAAFD